MEQVEINKQWKASQFNEYLGELQENKWVIYNNLSGAMVELNKWIYESISNNRIEEITNPSIQNSLQHGKLIIDRNLDEIEELKQDKTLSLRSKYESIFLYSKKKKNKTPDVLVDSTSIGCRIRVPKP